MNSYDEVSVFRRYVLNSNTTNCDLCLLEYEGQWLDADEIDEYIQAVHDEAAKHAVIGMLFCTESKATFYANTKIPSLK
jgi:hypothetical protein